MTFAAPLRLRLDSDALIANWKMMAALSGSAQTGAAVKADAYGLGAREVVPRLWQAGCRQFFVAHWGEAEAIADLVPRSSIAVLNGVSEDDVAPARALGAIPVLNTPGQIALWKQSGGGVCHVMLDTGINRLGLGAEQLTPDLLQGLDIDILLSHLASADEDSPQNESQLRTYLDMSSTVKCRRRSLANSAGILLGTRYLFDLTRPGISLYGGIISDGLLGKIRQVVSVEAKVLQVRLVRSGESLGYNATYQCRNDTRVATVSIGYADGYWRSFAGRGQVRFREAALPVLGRISMDLLLVDADSAPSIIENDWVAVITSLSEASDSSGMSQYELLTGLGRRSQRIWF